MITNVVMQAKQFGNGGKSNIEVRTRSAQGRSGFKRRVFTPNLGQEQEEFSILRSLELAAISECGNLCFFCEVYAELRKTPCSKSEELSLGRFVRKTEQGWATRETNVEDVRNVHTELAQAEGMNVCEAKRVFEAMITMKNIDIAAVEAARRG